MRQDFKTSQDQKYARVYKERQQKLRLALTIRKLRMEKGWSQTDLANAVGTKQSAIARLENAEYPGRPNISTLEKIANALNVDLEINLAGEREVHINGEIFRDISIADIPEKERNIFIEEAKKEKRGLKEYIISELLKIIKRGEEDARLKKIVKEALEEREREKYRKLMTFVRTIKGVAASQTDLSTGIIGTFERWEKQQYGIGQYWHQIRR